MENKRILITGGAGFIGSNLAIELYERGNSIVIVDNLIEGRKENLDMIKKDILFINVDIRDEKLYEVLSREDIDVIYHMAANFANVKSIENPIMDMEVNIAGTVKLLEFARQNGVKRFIYGASSSSFGFSAHLPIKEEQKHNPSTPYSISKLAAEYYTLAYNKIYGVETSSVIYFNVYGPREYSGMYRNVIPNFIHLALKNKPPIITGDGEETRDFTYVSDAVEGTILAGERKEAIGESFNIGSGKETKIKTLAEIINDICGNNAGIKYIERRKWDTVKRRVASIEKSKELLGYNPIVELDVGLPKTVNWFKENVKI